MPKHESKNCQRCGEGFECKTGSILLCQCQTVELSLEHLEYIAANYDDCLCASCLLDLRTEFNMSQHKERLNQFILTGHAKTNWR